MLEGMLARNRAFHGDVVVVKLLGEVDNTKVTRVFSFRIFAMKKAMGL